MERVSIAPSERHSVDYVADLYSVLVTLEKLEKAHHCDLVPEEQYRTSIRRLLDKYNAIIAQLKEGVETPGVTGTGKLAEQVGLYFTNPDGKGLDRFIAEFTIPCPAARARIQGKVVPSSQETSTGPVVDPKVVLEVGQHFITLMDSVKLQQTAVDQLHPILSDLLASLRLAAPEFEGLEKLNQWFERLNKMHASDQLDDRDTRELAFDLDRSYQNFHRFLAHLNEKGK